MTVDTLRQRAVLLLLIATAVMVAGAMWVFSATPEYTSVATVVLDSRRQVVTNAPEVLSDITTDSSVIDTQAQLIQSRAVVGLALDRLGLQQQADRMSAEYARDNESNPLVEAILSLPRGIFSDGKGDAAQETESSTEELREKVINWLTGHLEVTRVGLTSALTISHTSEDPRHAAEVANAVAAAYLAYQIDLKRQATKEANVWLSEQVADLKRRVERADAAVDAYRSKSGLLVARGATSTESQLTNLDVGFNEARKNLSDARARLQGYQTALRTAGAAEAAKIVATAAMQQLRSQFVALSNQRVQLSSTLGPAHPQMVELSKQIEALQEQMNVEARRTVQELANDVSIAEQKVTGLQQIRDQSRTMLAQDNAANVELTQLQTSATSLRTLYEEMLSRLQETTPQETLGQVNATIVSAAMVPSRPSSPKTKLVLAGSGIGGLALGALAVLLAQLMDTRITRPRDLERRTQLPVLAMVPKLGRGELRIGGKTVSFAELVRSKPTSLLTEAFRTLRAAIRQVDTSRAGMVVQVTSGTFAEGKTVSSIGFAQAAAMDGKRVLLIDADVRRRSATEYLGISADAGLMELLRGEVKLRSVILSNANERGADVLPLSRIESESHDLFSANAFVRLLAQLRKTYDLVVIDSAPVLAVAESLTIASRVDAVIVCVKWERTPVDIVLRALEEINRSGGRVVGTLLTQVNIKRVSSQSYGRRHYSALMKYYQQ